MVSASSRQKQTPTDVQFDTPIHQITGKPLKPYYLLYRSLYYGHHNDLCPQSDPYPCEGHRDTGPNHCNDRGPDTLKRKKGYSTRQPVLGDYELFPKHWLSLHYRVRLMKGSLH